MPRQPRTIALLFFLLVATLIDPSRAQVARAQVGAPAGLSVSDRFEQADSRRLKLKEGTTDRADAAEAAATLAGERAWQLYRQNDIAGAALWLERQVRLQGEHYAIWSQILDVDFTTVSAQANRTESMDDVVAWRALWLASFDVVVRTNKLYGRDINVARGTELARSLTVMNPPTAYFIRDAVTSAMRDNRVAAGMLARGNRDGARQLAAATQAVEVARAGAALRPPDGLKTDAPNLRMASLARALEELGTLERRQARFGTAEQHYNAALKMRRSMPERHPDRREHETLNRLGTMFREMGRIDDAREAFEEALASIERQPPPSPNAMARTQAAVFDNPSETLRDLGELLEQQGNFAGALERYRTAETEAARVADIVSREAAGEASLQGFIPQMARHALHIRPMAPLLRARLGEIDSARQDLQRVVNDLLKLGEASDVTSVLTARLGMLDLAIGNSDRASASFRLALGYFEAARDLPGMIYARMALARSLERLGRLEEAGTHAEAAFDMATRPGMSGQRARAAIVSARIRVTRGIGDGIDDRLGIVRQAAPLLSAEDRAAGLVVEGMRQEQLRRKPAALTHYRQAVAQIEHLRAEPFSQGRFYDAESHYEPYERLIRLLLEQGEVAEAFHYTLMSRTKELRQTHDDALASARPALQKLFTDERSLREKIQALTAAAPQSFPGLTPSDEVVAANELALGATVEQWRAVTSAIAEAEPAYNLFAKTPSLSDVQATLPPDTALVIYAAPRDVALQIFVVTRNRTRVFRSPVLPADLWSQVVELRRQLTRPPQGSGIDRVRLDRLRKLYDALIAPVQGELQAIDRLAILPSRALHYVPFPALLRRTGSQDRFLIEEKEIVQLSGAAFSALQNVRPTGQRPLTLAALADPANNLPDALGEVDHVRKLFQSARVLVGDDATSRGLHGVLEGASVFHYAGHAWPDPKLPGAGYLELAQPNTPDGRLTVSQIRALPLTGIELVTLSACEASQGQGEPRGLAITSLSDAFIMAGAHSVIGTLWKVDDGGARELMGEFYRRLTAGSCKGVSLREAQLALLRGGKFADPYYWAAFSLFGDWGDLNGRRASCAFTHR